MRRKKDIQNEKEAIAYLRKAARKWKGLRGHCRLLFQAIDIVLASLKGGETK